jgi:multidrug resistance efflux pump
MAFLPLVLAGFSALGSLADTNAQIAEMQTSAAVDSANATANRQQGQVALQQSNLEEEAQRRRDRQVMGEQRASIAQSGIGMLSSTGQRLQVDSAITAEQNALNVRYGGLLKQHGYEADARALDFRAKSTKKQIGRVRAAGYLNAFGAGLSSYTGAGGRFHLGTKPGVG